mmetsp:Transcript_50695/g.162238  ORF Transcript_50695/g.162238 Transcript_50695/m.162238 type:complete len:255 (-) Transcript_50695:691-1455(-)
MLHPWTSIRLGEHSMPPFLGVWTTWRCRACWPPPHDLSHSSQAVHCERAQSTVLLHGATSFRLALQAVPPFVGSRSTLRSRLLESPESLEHSLHSLHSSMTHGTGAASHCWELHMRNSSSWPSHSEPPFSAGSWIFRWRVCSPPPQLCEHTPQSDQRLSLQGRIGAGGALQEAVSSRVPWHSWPPLEAYWRTARLRYLCDSSFSQWPHSPQSERTQSSACLQSRSQRFVSTSWPSQNSPPCRLICVMTRCRSQS